MQGVTKQEFQNLVKRVEKLEGTYVPNSSTKKATTIREFILEKNPKSEVDKTVCLISFLENGGEEEINVKSLKKAFKDARERVPKNLSLAINRCARRGWINNVGRENNMKKWELSNSGIKYVENFQKAK